MQQDLAQLQANVEQEIEERRSSAGQKIVALHAEAQQHATEVRRRADAEAASAQQQLAAVQQDIQSGKQAVAELQTELDVVQQHLEETRQTQQATERQIEQLEQRLTDTRQELTAELGRLEEARHAAEASERHAKEVRARVQREAKRVADLAAAAVMAAAAGGADTGEYPLVNIVAAAADRMADPEPAASTKDNGHGKDAEPRVPAARRRTPSGKVAADAE
jgi:chromosome segregation ATPase